jgi:hypothetical protein
MKHLHAFVFVLRFVLRYGTAGAQSQENVFEKERCAESGTQSIHRDLSTRDGAKIYDRNRSGKNALRISRLKM